MCPTLLIDAAADSHVGLRRDLNEDSFACLPQAGLFLVADGLGGNPAGEVASRMAVDLIASGFQRHDPDDTWPLGSDSHTARLLASVHRANRLIHDAGRSSPQTLGMATTLAALLLSDATATVVHAGDSRVYRCRQGHLERLTSDPTLLEERLSHGDGSLDSPDDHLARALTRALGSDPSVELSVRSVPLLPGDLFLLCSDGLWGPVPEPDIAATLAWPSSLDAQVQGLLLRALEHGGPDNITCILARVRLEGD